MIHSHVRVLQRTLKIQPLANQIITYYAHFFFNNCHKRWKTGKPILHCYGSLYFIVSYNMTEHQTNISHPEYMILVALSTYICSYSLAHNKVKTLHC